MTKIKKKLFIYTHISLASHTIKYISSKTNLRAETRTRIHIHSNKLTTSIGFRQYVDTYSINMPC